MVLFDPHQIRFLQKSGLKIKRLLTSIFYNLPQKYRFYKKSEFIVSMVKSAFTFLIQDKFCIGLTVEFCKAPFGVTPKTFDAVDVRFATCKFVFVMKNTVVIIAIQNEAFQPSV